MIPYMIPTGYREQNGCHNCCYVFEFSDWDSGTEFLCGKILPLRPLCGSCGLNEDFSNDKAIKDKQRAAWESWSSGRYVDPSGICDSWEEDTAERRQEKNRPVRVP